MDNNFVPEKKMKQKLIFAALSMATALPVLAGDDTTGVLPEPSTIGLFVAAAIAITLVSKLKK